MQTTRCWSHTSSTVVERQYDLKYFYALLLFSLLERFTKVVPLLRVSRIILRFVTKTIPPFNNITALLVKLAPSSIVDNDGCGTPPPT